MFRWCYAINLAAARYFGILDAIAHVHRFCFGASWGMSFNRLIDHMYVAANPRTKNARLPTGEVTRHQFKLLLGRVWLCLSLRAHD